MHITKQNKLSRWSIFCVIPIIWYCRKEKPMKIEKPIYQGLRITKRWKGQFWKILRAVKILWYSIDKSVIYVSKSTECTTLRQNPNVLDGHGVMNSLWKSVLVTTAPFQRHVLAMKTAVCVWGRRYMGNISVLLSISLWTYNFS